jgi:hypothetical protein
VSEELHADLLRTIDGRADSAFREEFAALRAVVELHRPSSSRFHRGACDGDEFDGYDAEPPDWPCQTIVAVARALGEPYLSPCPDCPDVPLFDPGDRWTHRRDVHGD